MSIKGKAYIAGIFEHPTRKAVDLSVAQLHAEVAAGALAEAAGRANLSLEVINTADPATIAAADRIVLPGVGHYADCAANLRARPGLVAALESAVVDHKIPFLGICVGMQLMAKRGLEHVISEGLGWIDGEVRLIEPAPAPDGRALKVPHMGWNRVRQTQQHPMWHNIEDMERFYFVHSYFVQPDDSSEIMGESEYPEPFCAALGHKNIFAVQFHPEKSQHNGLQLLNNFLSWDGQA